MSKLYIGFSYPKKFKLAAYIISKWMKTDYSHVYIRFESSNPIIPSTVYHAAHGMVHFIELERFKKENNIIKEYELAIDENIRIETLVNCMKLAGEKYSYIQLFKILINDVCYQLNIKNQIYDSNGYICSELVGTLLKHRLGFIFNVPCYLLKPLDIDIELGKKYGLHIRN